MTDLRITQQARRMVYFEELVAAIRLAAKSAIRNPERVLTGGGCSEDIEKGLVEE